MRPLSNHYISEWIPKVIALGQRTLSPITTPTFILTSALVDKLINERVCTITIQENSGKQRVILGIRQPHN